MFTPTILPGPEYCGSEKGAVAEKGGKDPDSETGVEA
jgi:hypothetical protein